MLNAIIRFALRQRMLVLAAALLVTGYAVIWLSLRQSMCFRT